MKLEEVKIQFKNAIQEHPWVAIYVGNDTSIYVDEIIIISDTMVQFRHKGDIIGWSSPEEIDHIKVPVQSEVLKKE